MPLTHFLCVHACLVSTKDRLALLNRMARGQVESESSSDEGEISACQYVLATESLIAAFVRVFVFRVYDPTLSLVQSTLFLFQIMDNYTMEMTR